MSAGLFNSIVAVLTLAGLAALLYRPKVQESKTYKATIVPLGEIMDVGFIVFSPIIILLFVLLQHQELRAADRQARSAAPVELLRALGADRRVGGETSPITPSC